MRKDVRRTKPRVDSIWDYDVLKSDCIKDKEGRYLTKKRKISINRYAAEIISNYYNQVQKRKKDLARNLDKNLEKLDKLYVTTNEIKNISGLICPKGKLDYLWWGFTYILMDKESDFYQVGYSTQPHPQRLNWYLHDTLEGFRNKIFKKTGEKQIYGWILEYLVNKHGLDSFKNSKGRYDYKRIKKVLTERFEFLPLGVFWTEMDMKNSEDEIIKKVGKVEDVSKIDFETKHILDKYGLKTELIGKALNDPEASRKGSKSSNPYIYWTAYYIACGYSHRRIYKILVTSHSYKKSFSKFVKDFKILFDSINNARLLFANPIKKILREQNFSNSQINEIYPLLRDFDAKKFLKLTRKGYELKDLVPLFGYSEVNLRLKINDLIDEQFQGLPKYVDRNIRSGDIAKLRPSWEDLRRYVLLPTIISAAFIGMEKAVVAKQFYSPSKPNGFEEHTITDWCRQTIGVTYQELQDQCAIILIEGAVINKHIGGPIGADYRSMYNHIIENVDLKTQAFNNYGKARYIADKFRKVFIAKDSRNSHLLDKHTGSLNWNDMLSILEVSIVAIIGSLLLECYKSGFSPEKIKDTYKFFNNKYNVFEWTRYIFGTEMISTDIIRILKLGALSIYFKKKFGVILDIN